MADDFIRLPDLASRRLGGSVVYANDELFAERENLIRPEAPAYATYTFGHKGQVYDGRPLLGVVRSTWLRGEELAGERPRGQLLTRGGA
jgi:hypothetical protein